MPQAGWLSHGVGLLAADRPHRRGSEMLCCRPARESRGTNGRPELRRSMLRVSVKILLLKRLPHFRQDSRGRDRIRSDDKPLYTATGGQLLR